MERSKGANAAARAEGSGLLSEVEERVALACAAHGYRTFPLEFVFILDSFQYLVAPPSAKSRGQTTVTMTARMLCSYDPQAAATEPVMQGLSAYLVTASAPSKQLLFTEATDRFIKVVRVLLLSWATSAAGQAYRAAAPPAVAASIASTVGSHALSEMQVKAWREAGYAAAPPAAPPAVPLSGRKRARAYSSPDDMGSSTDAAVAPPRRARRRMNDSGAAGSASSAMLHDAHAGEEEAVVGSPTVGGAASAGVSPARLAAAGGSSAAVSSSRNRGDAASLRTLASLEMPFPREAEPDPMAVGCPPAPIVAAFPGIPLRQPVDRRSAEGISNNEHEDGDDDPGAASGAWCALLAAEEALAGWYRAVHAKAAAAAASGASRGEKEEEEGTDEEMKSSSAKDGGDSSKSSGAEQRSGLTVAALRAVLEAGATPAPEAAERLLAVVEGQAPAGAAPSSSQQPRNRSPASGAKAGDAGDLTNKAIADRLIALSHLPAFSSYVKHRTGGAPPAVAARRAVDGGDSGGAGEHSSSSGGGPADASHEKRGYETPLLATAWRSYKAVRGLDAATQLRLEALSKARLLRNYAVAPLEVRDDQDAGLLPALLGAHFPAPATAAAAGRSSPAAKPAATPAAEVADPLAYYPLGLGECIAAAGAYETGNPVVPPVARYTTLSKDRIMQVTHNADAVGAAVARGRPAPPLAPWLSTPSQQRMFEAAVWSCRYWNALAYHVPARVVEAVLTELGDARPAPGAGGSSGAAAVPTGTPSDGAYIPAHLFSTSDCVGPTVGDSSASGGGDSSGGTTAEAADASASVLTLPGTHGAVPQPEIAQYLLSRLVIRASAVGGRRALTGPPAASSDSSSSAHAVSSRGPCPLALARAAPAANALAQQLMATYPWLDADPGTFRLRLATEADCGSILRLIKELAVFEGQDTVANTVEALQRDGFGPEPCFYVILVEVPANVKRRLAAVRAAAEASPAAALLPDCLLPGALREGDVHNMYCNNGDTYPYEPVGMAFMHPSYSTWEGRTLYLEDLYITPAFRRYGLGSLLVRAAATVARVSGCQRLQWSCLQWNTGAMAMYRSPAINATQLADWTLFRLESPGLSHASGLGAVPGVLDAPGAAAASAPASAASATALVPKPAGRRQSVPRLPRGADLAAAFQAVVPDPALNPAALAPAAAAGGGEEPPPRSPARAPAWDAGSQSGDSAEEDDSELGRGALRRFSGGAWRDPFTPPPDVLQHMSGSGRGGEDEEEEEDHYGGGDGTGDEEGGGGDGDEGDAGYQQGAAHRSGSKHGRSTWFRDVVEGPSARGAGEAAPAVAAQAGTALHQASTGGGGRGGHSNRARRQVEAAGVSVPPALPPAQSHAGAAAASAASGPPHPAPPKQAQPHQGALSAIKSTFNGLSALAGLRPAQAKR